MNRPIRISGIRPICLILFGLMLFPFAANSQPKVEVGEWPSYGLDPGGMRYSPLNQINAETVGGLEEAWRFRTGDMAPAPKHYAECTPLMVDNTLYLITTLSRGMALNATTGEKKWVFSPDPPLDINETGGGGLASRGVAYWEQGDKKRIFLPVRDGRVYSLDAETGKPDPQFGDGGMINLREGLEREGDYLFLSSPPVVYEDLLIQGFGINDTSHERQPSVPIRAFNAHTGEEMWRFHTIPQEGQFGTETWQDDSWRNRGGGNVWSIMSVDPQNGLVFLPVSAPNPDFWGGERPGKNLFTNSVVALNARTGERVWHYQTIHHDLWDYDLPAQPVLCEVIHDGERIPAVAQVGKTGFVYLLHRLTGKPLFPIEEQPVPTEGVPGEQAHPTQPIPQKPPALVRQEMTEEQITQRNQDNYDFVRYRFDRYVKGTIFTPPSLDGTIIYPGLHGGMNWSGASVDPNGMMYVNTTEMPYVIRLEENPNGDFRYRTISQKLLDKDGYPGVKPPWGELIKVDLNEGTIVWRQPLGEFPELTEQGMPITGQENFGGTTITAGGLVFIAATQDAKIRAFDTQSGEVIWEAQLPAAGYATPITYLGSDGRQYVTIFAGGGGKLQTKRGDFVISFALPKGNHSE